MASGVRSVVVVVVVRVVVLVLVTSLRRIDAKH